jgi:hypothetical protein
VVDWSGYRVRGETAAPVKCRICTASRCDCIVVPNGSLHLTVPSWDSVAITLGPSITAEAVSIDEGRIDSGTLRAMVVAVESGDLSELRSIMAGRRECVIGRRASVPPVRIFVHLDAAAALRHAEPGTSGDWHAALPLRPRSTGRDWMLRGFRAGVGVVEFDEETPYDVVSHNWPRLASPPSASTEWCHAGVLGIWWGLHELMLPQVESALAIAERCGNPVWVDYLSIDQGDAADKENLMKRMGRIYARSSRGFVDCTRAPGVATIDPVHVKELIAEPVAKYSIKEDSVRRLDLRNIAEAPWFSRCWTFQEALLPRDLTFFDPSRLTVVGDFAALRARCLEEFRHMHDAGGHDTAKREGWFTKAASLLTYDEMIAGGTSWNLGRILCARGNRGATEECDQLNSLLGMLDVRCGYEDLPTARTLDEESVLKLAEACGRNGDTSWIAGEDTTVDCSQLPWAPSSMYAHFTTQAEADSVIWVRMTNDGPELRFHSSYPVVDVVPATDNGTVTLSRLIGQGVGGEWISEYCGITFGSVMDDPLPIDPEITRQLFVNRSNSIQQVEGELRALLPRGAKWRANELTNYMTGFAGRFNSWLVCQTPVRRVAFMAKLIPSTQPHEVLVGKSLPSTYRPTHRYFPLMVVDGAPISRRVGWVWPCVHSSLEAAEAEPNVCTRIIRS